jgi:hypothetical protein
MNKIDGNEPATGYGFSDFSDHFENPGLTIRQQFAAMAMQGLLANKAILQVTFNLDGSTTIQNLQAERTAILSIRYADALINELNKTT